jgi:hypothetical protein
MQPVMWLFTTVVVFLSRTHSIMLVFWLQVAQFRRPSHHTDIPLHPLSKLNENMPNKRKRKRGILLSLVFSMSQAFVSIYSCNVHWMLNLMLINPHISDMRPLIILFLISFSFFFL